MTIFRTPFDQFKDRDGETVAVDSEITPGTEGFDDEVLPMFRVHFADGFQIEAWPEELIP